MIALAALAFSEMLLPIGTMTLSMSCYPPADLTNTFAAEGKTIAWGAVAKTGELIDVWISPNGDFAITLTLRLPGSPMCIAGEGTLP